jgi:hypothetical protein
MATVLPTVMPRQKAMAVIAFAVLKFHANQKALIPIHRTATDRPANLERILSSKLAVIVIQD